MFRFAHPYWLLTLVLLPVVALAHRRWYHIATLQYSNLQLVKHQPRSLRLRLRWLLDAMRLLSLAVLILAVARPQSGEAKFTVHGRGVDIVLALDISGSMAALDFQPQNRLQAAKQVVDAFIATRGYDRIGLVVFARGAFTQSPPTLDYRTLRRQLEAIELAPELGLEDGTAIGLGLAQAAALLAESPAKSRVIIILTDGVSNAGPISPLTAAQAAAALGIRIYTIGVARPGMVPVPAEDPSLDSAVEMVESKIDEESLRKVAVETGGSYFRANDADGLRRVYAQIDSMEKSEVTVQDDTRYRELAGWFLLPALGLMLAEIVLRNTLWRSLP
jgi:Ca-activated chloride channel family protein